MIVHPKNWESVGQEVSIDDIESAIQDSVDSIDCNSLALSGGVDSSLLLYYMTQKYPKVYAYTIGKSEDHPDVVAARQVASMFPNVEHRVFIPTEEEIEEEQSKGEDFPGDAAVRLLYKYASQYTDSIVTGDAVDEFMAGYYAHQEDPSEETYYDFMSRLQDEQLIPLDKNSGSVEVYLPYIDGKLVCLMSQIPLSRKADKTSRKKILREIARSKFPEEIVERRKLGFISAISGKFGKPDLDLSDYSDSQGCKSEPGVRQVSATDVAEIGNPKLVTTPKGEDYKSKLESSESRLSSVKLVILNRFESPISVSEMMPSKTTPDYKIYANQISTLVNQGYLTRVK